MTLPTGMGEMRKYSDDELKKMLEESREASKHSRKLGRVMGIVADRRLQQLQHFQAMKQLATWRRTHGYDRDESWMHDTLLLSPQEFTASVWSDLQELKDAISMSGKARPWQKTREFVDERQVDLPGKERAAIKRYAESRNREAAQVTVTPVSTAQSTVFPARSIPRCRRMCMSVWKKRTWVG